MATATIDIDPTDFPSTSGSHHVSPNLRSKLVTMMRSCGESADPQRGESIRLEILRSPALHRDIFILNHLLQMLGACGSITQARSTFDSMQHRNIFSWNIMIAAYAQNGHYSEALELFRRISCTPTKVTFVNTLAACGGLGDLSALSSVLHQINPGLLENEVVLGTAIITASARCGDLVGATLAFDRMRRRDAVCFNAMIAAAAQCGEFDQALKFFRRMLLEGVPPTPATLLGFVSGCRDLHLANHLRSLAAEIGADLDLNTCNSLLTMYASCGSVSRAWEIFSWMRERDVVTWNAMIAGFVQCGECRRALELSRFMDQEGVAFEEVTFIVLLGACSEIDDGLKIQARASASGMAGLRVVQTAILGMLGRCGRVDLALEIFSGMESKEETSFNAMISVLVQHGRAGESLGIFGQMIEQGLAPNRVTFINLVEACAMLESLPEARRVLGLIDRQMMESDVAIATLAVNTIGICGGLEDAQEIFAGFKNKREPSIWNAMIGAYSQNSEPEKALSLLRFMDLEGVKLDEVSFITLLSACEDLRSGCELHSRIKALGLEETDLVIATSLVTMYSRCGDLVRASEVFHRMKSRDTISWNAMVSGFAGQGAVDRSMKLVLEMDLEGMQPGESALAAMTSSCQGLTQAREVHRFVELTGVDCGVFLIHMYTRCGCRDLARDVFDRMEKSSVATWNSLLAAYAQTGHLVEEITGAFYEMVNCGIQPDDVSFINVLSALTNAGILSRSKECFEVMVGDFGVEASVEHFGCLINLLARAGKLNQAQELMGEMPFEPDAMVWTSLLSASAIHSSGKDDPLAGKLAESAVKNDPRSAAPYVLFSNAIRHR